jgi:hypothetical protein
MEPNQELSTWTNQTIGQIVLSETIDTNDKKNQIAKYIEYKIANPSLTTGTYPLINLLYGYYGLDITIHDAYQSLNKDYGVEFTNSINNLSSEQILAGLTLGNFMYTILKSI